MPRDEFISDNLIDIRDRLRENYESKKSPAGQQVSQGNSAAIHIDLKNPVMQTVSAGGRSADREYNEFAGRLRHDTASLAAELSALKEQQEALIQFNASLADTAEKLKQLDVQDSADFFRELDRLRITYFQASGAAAPFRKTAAAPAIKVPSPDEEVKPPEKNILLSIAVLLAAVIVSLTLICLFA